MTLARRGGDAHRRGARAARRATGSSRRTARSGAALCRGYPLRTFMCQLFGNADDPVKGRQMPVHHSVRRLNFVSISSPVGTQIPQAVGHGLGGQAAEEGRRRARRSSARARTSTPTSTSALNFAGVFKAPAIFFCRNNGWAISVPRSKQTATPTFAQKAIAYGMPGVLRRRQRPAGDDSRRRPRRRRARAARRGADADRGAHLPPRRAQLVGRSVGLPRSGRAQGVGAPRSARALPHATCSQERAERRDSRRAARARSPRRSPTRS